MRFPEGSLLSAGGLGDPLSVAFCSQGVMWSHEHSLLFASALYGSLSDTPHKLGDLLVHSRGEY